MSQQTSMFAVLKSLDKTRFSYAVLTLTELRSLLTLSSRGPHLRSFPLITTVTGRTSSRHWQLILVIMEIPVSYTHLRAHETRHDLVCRLLLEKKKKKNKN